MDPAYCAPLARHGLDSRAEDGLPLRGPMPEPVRAEAFPKNGLQHRQIAVELPLRDLHAVVVPLLSLDLDVAVEHVLAERAQHEL
jgi:hypothetical protein